VAYPISPFSPSDMRYPCIEYTDGLAAAVQVQLTALLNSLGNTVALQADISRTNDATPIALPGFAFNVPVGETWAFDAWVDHNSGASGAQWSIGNGDGGVGGSSVHWEVWTWTSGTVRSNVQDVASFLTTANLGIAPGRRWYQIRGTVTAGTLVVPVQLDVKMPVATTTITSYRGSYMRFQKVVPT